MKDIESLEDIKTLVDTFYSVIMKDSTIGFFFTEVAPIDMETHMPIMYRFWGSMLLGSAEYSGNPMQKHFAMNRTNPMLPEHFDIWLSTWISTVDTLFKGEKAEEAKTRAKNIASLMSHNMNAHR